MRNNLTYLLILVVAALSGQTSFYDAATIQKIELQFSFTNWDYRLDTAKLGADGYVMADYVLLNGSRYDSVGVKYKGNSSFDSTFKKNPVHIELDAFKTADYQGVRDIKLNNAYADPSLVREVMAYTTARNYMDAPQANFAKLYINGRYIGLYTNAESINKAFLSRHFYSNTGVFVKGNPELTPSPSVKSNLKYLGADTSLYKPYYELKSDTGWGQLANLCDVLSNNPSQAASVMDMDRALWMLALNTVLVNLDSYTGAFAQNYYVYKDGTGRFNPIMWDLNMSFGGFPFLGSSNTSLGSLSIANMQVLAVGSHSADAYWPLIKAVYSDATWKRMYFAHIKTLSEELIATGTYSQSFTTYTTLVQQEVADDTCKFFTTTQFNNSFNTNISVGSYSVPGIQTLMSARLNYLKTTEVYTNVSPTISGVSASINGAQVVITATVSGVGSGQVIIGYRSDERSAFTKTFAYDDGAHNDGAAGDNVYGCFIAFTGNFMQHYVYAENTSAGIFSPERAEHEFYQLERYPLPISGDLVINEFLAENTSDVRNEYHLFEDWIELYNNSDHTIRLDGVYLSDENDNLPIYRFPIGASLGSHQYVTVWADNLSPKTQLHANFKLNAESGQIILSNGCYEQYDAVTYTNQEKNRSLARCPDGNGVFKQLVPTWSFQNCVVGVEEITATKKLQVYPNPANTSISIACECNQMVAVRTVMGQLIAQLPVEGQAEINTSQWAPGMYLVSTNTETFKLIITH